MPPDRILAGGTKHRSLPIPRLECSIYITITAGALGLHLVFLLSAGGLWRDEVSSVQLAGSPTFLEMCRSLDTGVLFPTLLRLFLFVGHADLWLRVLGFLTGLTIIAALWLNARSMGFRLPFLSLGLLGANLALVRWGDSLRAYGLAALFALLVMGRIWSLMQSPTARSFAIATVVSVLSVHCLFQNAFLLGGVCAAGVIVCMLRKQSRAAVLVLAAGALAALSLFPYYSLFTSAGESWGVLRSGFNGSLALSMLNEALASPPWVGPSLWVAALLFAAAIGIATLSREDHQPSLGAPSLALFGGGSACLGVIGYFCFLALARLPTQPWYYIPLMAFVAGCADAALARWFVLNPRRWAVGAAVLCCVALPFSAKQASFRQTNIDLVADYLNTKSKPMDLIIVYPWYCGVTFQYYYKGSASWTTLPSLADHHGHRYDLLKDKLASEDPIKDVQDRSLSTVAVGGRLWLVGQLPPPVHRESTPPTLPPAPKTPTGWADGPYTSAWGRQFDCFLKGHGIRLEPAVLTLPAAVNSYETPPLLMSPAAQSTGAKPQLVRSSLICPP